jgi:glycosyltransferase involved in cell wall biosynthesis
MPKEPLLSILCETYNHEYFIREAIAGFLIQQTTFPIEILIHDDASTDNTPNIIREYERNYPELIFPIYQKENQYSKGKKPRLAFQFPRARGKYIALCEGDDYWTDPLKLQKQVEFLEGNEDHSMSCHASKMIVDNNTDNYEFSKMSDKDESYSIQEFLLPLSKNRIRTESVIFRNKFIENYPEWARKVVVGDFPLFLILASKGKIRYINEVMSVYRKHAGGVWTSERNNNEYTKKYYLSTIKMYQDFNEYTNKIHESDIRKVISHRYYKLFMNIKGDNNVKKHYFLKYWRKMPFKYQKCLFKKYYVEPLMNVFIKRPLRKLKHMIQ